MRGSPVCSGPPWGRCQPLVCRKRGDCASPNFKICKFHLVNSALKLHTLHMGTTDLPLSRKNRKTLDELREYEETFTRPPFPAYVSIETPERLVFRWAEGEASDPLNMYWYLTCLTGECINPRYRLPFIWIPLEDWQELCRQEEADFKKRNPNG